MAEKTKTKKLESKKEAYESPVAEAAEKVVEKNIEATTGDLEKEIDKELEGTEKVEVEAESVNEDSPSSVNGKDEYAEEIPESDEYHEKERKHEKKEEEKYVAWEAKTKLGKEIRAGKIKNIDEILDSGRKILEDKIVDSLIDVKTDLIAIGQSKGKFGGGKRRAWRQTQKKTEQQNIPTFSAMAVVGDENGHVGVGMGKAKETLPARDKAIRQAKLNLIKIKRACGSFDCSCNEKHSIPFKVTGKMGSVELTLIPAPQGTGLVVANEVKKVLQLAGIKDIYSKTSGKKRTSFNLIGACIEALKKTNIKSREEGRK